MLTGEVTAHARLGQAGAVEVGRAANHERVGQTATSAVHRWCQGEFVEVEPNLTNGPLLDQIGALQRENAHGRVEAFRLDVREAG